LEEKIKKKKEALQRLSMGSDTYNKLNEKITSTLGDENLLDGIDDEDNLF
jgi:hypothetical protein